MGLINITDLSLYRQMRLFAFVHYKYVLMEHCKVTIMNSPVLLIATKHAYEYLICYAVTCSRNQQI